MFAAGHQNLVPGNSKNPPIKFVVILQCGEFPPGNQSAFLKNIVGFTGVGETAPNKRSKVRLVAHP
jgi:hypothetical protein